MFLRVEKEEKDEKRSKGTLGMVVLISVLLMALGVGPAMAFTVVPPYESMCTADYYMYHDEGPDHAFVGYAFSHYAEAQADDWELGSKVYASVDENNSFAGSLSADAWFSQQFVVTAAGTASINFAYDGYLSAANLGDGTINGMYGLNFVLDASDDYGNSGGDSGYLDSEGYAPYSGTFSFDYDFAATDVGDIFTVELYLQTRLDAEYIDYMVEEGQTGGAEFTAHFYNTAEIVNVTGGLAPVSSVPIPGAAWLLGSGIIGLAGFRRRLKRK